MRSVWKGSIAFGLVNVPVSMYPAAERERLAFRLLHAKDASPIDYRRFCSAENVEVPWEEIVRGYESEKGRFVVLTDEDFERARAAATRTIDIRDFVPAAQIDWVFIDQPYYLEPTRAGVKGYSLLRDALGKSRRVGIGTVVLRQREHLVAVRPENQALVVTTLRFASEIRPVKDLDLPGTAYDKREMDLALQLVKTLEADWRPEQYHDTYAETLMRVIQQKLEGREIEVPPARRPAKVVDLATALRRSLEAQGPERRSAPARRPRPAGRRRKPARRRAA